MFRVNDRRLLAFGAVALLIAFFASATGISRSPIDPFVSSVSLGWDRLIILLGYLGWYFFLMYAFALPGMRRLSELAVPGVLAAVAGAFLGDKLGLSTADQPRVIAGLLGCALGYPALFRMCYERWSGSATGEYRRKLDALLFAIAALLLFVTTPEAFLDITVALHPVTFDVPIYHFESTLGFQPSVALGLMAEGLPLLKEASLFAYSYMPFGFSILIGAQIARSKQPCANVLAAWFMSGFIATIAYHLLPASGPKYLFQNLFPAFMPSVDALALSPTLVSASPRNAVPSMHFGWALMLWLNACLLEVRWLRAGFALLLGMTILATLSLGEHYLIDLVIAVPVIVAVQGLALPTLPWNHPLRRRAVAAGFWLWFGWVLALRFGVPVFKAVPGLSWIAILATLWASFLAYRPLEVGFKQAWARELSGPPPAVPSKRQSYNPDVRWVAVMFFMSGFAGLVYEVIFAKALALTFGGTATAVYTVLATYMGGMAIGSWLGARLAAGREKPLLFYAGCELGIGLYCMATPAIFMGIRYAYVHLAGDVSPDAGGLTLFRLLLGVTALLVPTILMGMTLPILVRFFETRSYSLGRSVAVLYAVNTIGAAVGALLAGYVVMPLLGIQRTTLMAALLDLIVVLMALKLHQRAAVGMNSCEKEHALTMPGTGETASGAGTAPDPGADRRLGLIALVVLGIGGIVTLALEIDYVHLLAVVAGNSAYAFSLMLFTFLFGLGMGAEAARHLLKRERSLALLLGQLEFGLAIVILGGTFLWTEMPDYFASFASYPLTREFGAREVVRGIVCWLAMFPPALLIGAIYPVAMECIGRAYGGRAIQALGRAAALNTLGNILGVFLGGFLMLPYLGSLRSAQVLAGVCFILGLVAIRTLSRQERRLVWAPAAVAGLLLFVQPTSFDYTKLASGANVYFANQGWGRVIDHAESIDGGLTTVSRSELPGAEPQLTLLTNGKFQGNDSNLGEMQAQIGFALAPLLHTDRRDRALVIGYGTGVSTRTLHEAGFKQLDLVDLSADIVRLSNKHFGKVNARVTDNAGVSTFITDGRNFLLLQDRKYDIVGLEITSIWFAGAASLYNQEFYQLVKKRLHPRGILQQWMQFHHVSNEDVLRILGSVRAEFKYIWLYSIGKQGIIVASNDPQARPSQQNVNLIKQTPGMQGLLKILDQDPGELLASLLLEPEGADRLLNSFDVPASAWVSTDDNLYLEYSTPKGNVLDAQATFDANARLFSKH